MWSVPRLMGTQNPRTSYFPVPGGGGGPTQRPHAWPRPGTRGRGRCSAFPTAPGLRRSVRFSPKAPSCDWGAARVMASDPRDVRLLSQREPLVGVVLQRLPGARTADVRCGECGP